MLEAWELKKYAGLVDPDRAFAPPPKGMATSPQAYVLDQKFVEGAKRREAARTFGGWLPEGSALAAFDGRPSTVRDDVPRWTADRSRDKPGGRPSVSCDRMSVVIRPELLCFYPRRAVQLSKSVEEDDWKPVAAGQKWVEAALKELAPRQQQELA